MDIVEKIQLEINRSGILDHQLDNQPQQLTPREKEVKERLVLAQLVSCLQTSDVSIDGELWQSQSSESLPARIEMAWYSPGYYPMEIDRLKNVIIVNRYIIANMNITQLCNDTGMPVQVGLQSILIEALRSSLGNSNISDGMIENQLNAIPDDKYKEAIIKRDMAIQEALKIIQKNLNTWVNSSLSLSNAGALAEFVKDLLQNYFVLLVPVDARYVIAHYLSQHGVKVDDKNEALSTVFKSSGPYFHKLLQLMAGNLDDDNEMKIVMMDMLDNLSPLDEVYTKVICKEVGEKANINDLEIEKSLGFASVGCAYLCKSTTNNQQYVLKIMRPSIQNRAERDRCVLLYVAQKHGDGIKNTVNNLCENINSELNLADEARKQIKGAKYREMDIILPAYSLITIGTLGVCDVVGVASKDYMLQAVAPGKTVKYAFTEKKIDSGRLLKCLFSLSANWVKEALFGDGYVHCDLHSGNMLYEEGGQLTIIDFGNFIKFTREGQKDIFNMMISAALKQQDNFWATFSKILGNDLRKLRLQEQKSYEFDVKEVIKNNTNPVSAILSVLTKGLDCGLKVPQGLVSFARSAVMLSDALEKAREQVYDHIIQPRYKAMKSFGPFEITDTGLDGYTFSEAVECAIKAAGKRQIFSKTNFSVMASGAFTQLKKKF